MAKSSDQRDPDPGDAEGEIDAEDEFDSDSDGDDTGRPTGRPGPVDRIREALLPPKAGSGKVTTRRAIEQLDDRERRLSFAAAGASVVFGVLIYVIETSDKSFRLTKGELTPQTTLVIGLVAGALIFGATLVGRRAPVGFVALFTFLAFGTRYLLGVPFLALAVWLLYRSFKIQKEAAAARKAAGTTGPASSARGGRASTASSASSRPASKAGAKKKGPATPEANKRYTPKRPPPPAPKPSRRERKATKASD